MIKGVFFDAIDTLFMPDPNKIEMYQRIIKQHTNLDVPTATMQKVWNEIMEETEEAACEENDNLVSKLAWSGFNTKILQKLNFSGDCNKVGEALHNESWDNPVNYFLAPDVLPALKDLKEMNIKIACVSNEDLGLYDFFTQFGIKEYFDEIIISEEVGHEKPGKRIFEIALERLKLAASDVIYVGDSVLSDYKGSQEAGLVPVLIDREEKIIDNNLTKIKSLTELTKIIEGENINAHAVT